MTTRTRNAKSRPLKHTHQRPKLGRVKCFICGSPTEQRDVSRILLWVDRSVYGAMHQDCFGSSH